MSGIILLIFYEIFEDRNFIYSTFPPFIIAIFMQASLVLNIITTIFFFLKSTCFTEYRNVVFFSWQYSGKSKTLVWFWHRHVCLTCFLYLLLCEKLSTQHWLQIIWDGILNFVCNFGSLFISFWYIWAYLCYCVSVYKIYYNKMNLMSPNSLDWPLE